MNDPNFNFSFNFNEINQLIFSTNTTLKSASGISSIPMNPTLQSSNQNGITVMYSDENQYPVTLTASIDTINIMQDIIFPINPYNKNQYAIVLSGNVLTASNATLYIIIPFVTQAQNNATPNSKAIETIVNLAKAQIIDGVTNTSLGIPAPLNDLITPGSTYYYVNNPEFRNRVTNKPFIIYKGDAGQISEACISLLNTFTNGNLLANTSENPLDDLKTNQFTPLIKTAPINSEIMIDCSPVEITTDGGNVMFSSQDTIFGNFVNDSSNKAIITYIYFFFVFIIFVLIIQYIIKALIRNFVAPDLFPKGPKGDK